MNFRKKIFKSKLTNLIQNDPQVTLEDVLLHEQLSITIKNESEILYNRILQKNEDNWLLNIFEYSLFDKKPPAKYQIYNTINQINKNASNFLENCGPKFIKFFRAESNDSGLLQPEELYNLLALFIRKFTEKPEIYKNTTSAGFFQRFIENFLRYQVLDENEIIKFLIPFLVQNCRILAYQQLICTILSDYFDFIHEEICTDFLLEILERAAGAVCFIRKHKSKSPQNVIKLTKKLYKKQNITIDNQPVNLKRKPIPLITSFFNDVSDEQDLNENVKNKHLPTIPKIIYENKEDAEIEAYLLLMSIRKAVSMQRNIIDYFRENYEFIKYLLYCGTRSEENSLISLEAFKLLSIIFNGSIQLSIKSWKILDNEKSQIPFYNNFADEMVFNPKFLTYKMIHALPVFWNHRYNIESDELSKKEKFDVNDYYQNERKHFRTREKGETAFEILQPCLICEPPLSSQLIYNSIDILIQLIKKSKSNDSKVIYGIIHDFLEHFDISIETLFSKSIVTKDFSQLLPTDYYYKENSKSKRAILNGFIADFFLRLTNTKLTFFFPIRDHTTNIQNTEKTYGLDLYVKMMLDETLYNKPIHNDFCFEEEENNINEISTNILSNFNSETLCNSSLKQCDNLRMQLDSKNRDIVNLQICCKDQKKRICELEKQLIQKTKEIEELKQKKDIPPNLQKSNVISIMDTYTLKSYKKVKEVGRGINGTVYEAINEAIKEELYILKEASKHNTDSFQNLIKEYELLTNLDHPNIIKTYGFYFGDNETMPTIVLEHCTQNLKDAIISKSLSNPQLVYYIYQIAEGMKYIHFLKVIHRDLKPSNIVIAKDGTIKICDFGISKVIDPDSFSSMTNGLGTFLFMAPEILNEEDYNEKVDVYSFGVLVFFILSGGKMPEIIIRDICLGKKAPLPPTFNMFAKDLINKCWNFDPKQRPSFDEICSMLEANNYQLIDLDEESKENALNLINKHKKLIPFDSH